MAAPGQTLEALVRDELRGPVGQLVRKVVVELVHEQLNGAVPEAEVLTRIDVVAAPTAQETIEASTEGKPLPPVSRTRRTCARCGEEKDMIAFGRGRRVCRRCRGLQERERARQRRARIHEPSTSPNGAEAPVPLGPSPDAA